MMRTLFCYEFIAKWKRKTSEKLVSMMEPVYFGEFSGVFSTTRVVSRLFSDNKEKGKSFSYNIALAMKTNSFGKITSFSREVPLKF